MKIEEYLNDLKKEYEKTEATLHLKAFGWDELSRQIDPTQARRRVSFRNLGIVFAVLVIFLMGTYRISLAALPGEILYPVKLLSEEIIQKTSGSNQVIIDHRASEIIELSEKQKIDDQNLEEVVTEYRANVEQARQNLKVTGKSNEDLQNNLDEHHSEFERIGRDHPEIEDKIKEARDASDREDDETDD
ncbi:MAG: hypothetical protein UV71_C0004G0026 [Microgenomates group bacterium GW2011_GWC1_43_13]|uniref:DUF5667 domain-containing protein n=1 Tax=Candidatus Woesebacteria bacterium GW2011_GWB1_44_11 TaxID=1618579 RepID=A0A837I4Z1_9BACT|nr:MAG: hypothetical protein UV71_C0004G0026 [Microgenomates group bacterium GW2011_GWC1_43_13]KKT33008.1 MAG: hypothetical protein UW20_C0006G0025 [Candidatus Woesebacteria bacterium GW2011_GWB1_44_11]OGM81875.1 MAG: hypothetical protein A2394_00130 [Candidatus Woesebacteria bacterium RIFOXYB1_FULL_42_36]